MFGSRNKNNLSGAALKVLISEVLGQKNWQILSEPCAVSGRHPDRPWQCCLLSPFAKENKLRNSKFYLKTLKTTRDGLMKTKDNYVIANTRFFLFEAERSSGLVVRAVTCIAQGPGFKPSSFQILFSLPEYKVEGKK